MIDVNACPICSGNTFKRYITTRDFSVSKETFNILSCSDCGMLVTSPRPAEADLGRYYQSENYISHSGSPKSVTDQIYWIARQFALRTKFNLIRQTNPKTLLDYGCGTGTFLSYCKKKGITVTGVEPSETARTIAAAQINPRPIYDRIESCANDYDIITLWHVLEHVPDLNHTIAQLKERLAEKGRIFIAVPNVTSWESKRYGEYWAAFDVPRHLWHFSSTTIEKIFQRHDLSLQQTLPMKLDSFYISLLSEKYKRNQKTAPIGMINAFKNGLISNLKARTTGAYSSLIYIFHHA